MTARRRRTLVLSIGVLLVLSFTSHAQDISLPRRVPAFNQAYNEGPGAWGNCALGTVGCPDQVCTTGCLVTAFASVLGYYEIELSVPARSSCTGEARSGMDPGIFNDWLREEGGYGRCAQDPVGNCCLIWGQLPEELSITTHTNRSEVGVNPVASVVIDHALRQGHPVVAGVHWGAFCNSGSTQTEDCHWVILTGKRNGVYTIIDPFNPDPTSPNGIRTTLDAGVHGNYIIDRYVIVAGPAANITLNVSTTSQKTEFSIGDRLRIGMRVPGSSQAYLPFARATRPDGTLRYATLNAAGKVTFTSTRSSLIAQPRSLNAEWVWLDTLIERGDTGSWTWDVWVERTSEPGIKAGQRTVAYTVSSLAAGSSVGAAILGIALVIAIAAVAFITILPSGID